MQRRIAIQTMEKALVLLLISSSLLMIMTPRSQAHSGDVVYSSWVEITPTIDGILTPGEWDSPVITKTLEYMNDEWVVDYLIE